MNPPANANPSGAAMAALAAWAPELAQTFVTLACDLAVVVDDAGTVQLLAQDPARPIAPPDWVGRRLVDTADEGSRGKVEALLAEAAQPRGSRRREINHPNAIGGARLVAYTAVKLGPDGPMLVVGLDQQDRRAEQQRFLAAQEALEHSYWRAMQMRPGGGELRVVRAATAPGGARTAPALSKALDELLDRIGPDALPTLLDDARRLAERHFLLHALQRSGGLESLAAALGIGVDELRRHLEAAAVDDVASDHG